MKTLEEFLSKFKLIEDPKSNRLAIIGILERFLNIKFNEDSVKIKGNLVIISVEPTIKSYIFTKKEAVLSDIQNKLSLKKVTLLFK